MSTCVARVDLQEAYGADVEVEMLDKSKIGLPINGHNRHGGCTTSSNPCSIMLQLQTLVASLKLEFSIKRTEKQHGRKGI